jgi:aminoglycoside phosphotransferase (APT) family kinase protein
MNADATDIDGTSLARFLESALEGFRAPVEIERISGGQSNPTYFVTSPTHRLVLRRRPCGDLLPSAHAIDREFRVQRALADTDVPVPVPRLLCEDTSVIGTSFYVMDRLEGRVFSDCTLPGVPPVERRQMYLAMAQTLARLHAVDWRARGLGDFGRPGDYFERQIGRWSRQWTLSDPRPNADVARLLAWLPANLPPSAGTVIAHGDYRIGNLIFHPQAPRVVGVLDWELATLGDPMADVAYSALAWRLDADEYMGMRDRDPAALGIPSEQEYLAHYAQVAGREVVGREVASRDGRCMPFHFAFALFRLAVIFEGIAARARQGNANSDDAGINGDLVARFARHACEAIDQFD